MLYRFLPTVNQFYRQKSLKTCIGIRDLTYEHSLVDIEYHVFFFYQEYHDFRA